MGTEEENPHERKLSVVTSVAQLFLKIDGGGRERGGGK